MMPRSIQPGQHELYSPLRPPARMAPYAHQHVWPPTLTSMPGPLRSPACLAPYAHQHAWPPTLTTTYGPLRSPARLAPYAHQHAWSPTPISMPGPYAHQHVWPHLDVAVRYSRVGGGQGSGDAAIAALPQHRAQLARVVEVHDDGLAPLVGCSTSGCGGSTIRHM